MSELISEINSSAEFDAAVQSGVTLVDFFATWCHPCKMQVPILEQVAAELAGKAKIIKVDTEKNQELAQKFNVELIPTLILFKDGGQLDRMEGVQQGDALKALMEGAAS